MTFSSNDYLGLSRHPEVVEACRREAQRSGVGSGASRPLGGSLDVHLELEEHIARFEGTEAAVVLGSGYLANVAALTALFDRGDVVASDALNHASIIDGCRIAGVTALVYPHAIPDRLVDLAGDANVRAVVTDGVFSMDGDLAPLPEIIRAAGAWSALVIVDEAHATGVVGPTGRGSAEHFGLEGRHDVTVGTLSKAIGCTGGFVAGPADVVDQIRARGRSYVFSTSLPPPVAAAASAAFKILGSDISRLHRLRRNVDHFRAEAAGLGFAVARTASAITPLHIGDARTAHQLSAMLRERGIIIPAVAHPVVPKGAARLRAIVTAEHSEQDIELTIGCLRDCLSDIGEPGGAPGPGRLPP